MSIIEEVVVTGRFTSPVVYFIVPWEGFVYDYSTGLGGGNGDLSDYAGDGFISNNANAADGEKDIETKEGCKIKLFTENFDAKENGLISKLAAEGHEDSIMKGIFEYCAKNNLTLNIYMDDEVHMKDGTTMSWESAAALKGVSASDIGAFSQLDTEPNGVSYINIKLSSNGDDFPEFRDSVVHELLHIQYHQPHLYGDALEEDIVDFRTPTTITNIFGDEDDYLDYFLSGKAIGDSSDEIITGNNGFNDIRGGGGDDIIFGGTSDDYLNGGAGDDTINGGAGNDILIPGAPGTTTGGDVLNGGSGDDTYILEEYAAIRTINDSSGTDSLLLNTDDSAYVYHHLGNDDITIIGLDSGSTVLIKNGDSSGKIETVMLSNGIIISTVDTYVPPSTPSNSIDTDITGVPSAPEDIIGFF